VVSFFVDLVIELGNEIYIINLVKSLV